MVYTLSLNFNRIAIMADEFLSALHRAAIEYARDGIPIFPCVEGGKTPAIPGGFKSATIDEKTINEWWARNPNYNLAVCPDDAGWYVVDVEYNGIEDWEKYYTGRTYTNKTPRGGRHFIFQGSGPSKVRFMNGYSWDTRGRGGYILLPPSMVDGKEYETIDEAPLEPIPEFVRKNLEAQLQEKRLAPEGIDFDHTASLTAARDWLKRQPAPVQGERNNATFKAAAQLKDFGCNAAEIHTMLEPWGCEELDTAIKSAFKNSQNEVGCDAVPPMSEVFKDVEAPKEKPRTNRFELIPESEMDNVKEGPWTLAKLIPGRGCVVIYGPPRSYKSFIALDMALCIATGTPFAGVKPIRTGPVVFITSEGPVEVMTKRRPAWKLARGVEAIPNFFMIPHTPLIKSEEQRTEFLAAIDARLKGQQLGALFLETAAKMMVGMDATKDVGYLQQFCDQLSDRYRCPIVLLHHSSRDLESGPKDSSTYEQAFDTVLRITRPNPADLVCELAVMKHKDAPEPAPFYFEGTDLAGSLTFQHTTKRDLEKTRREASPYAEAKVAAALRKLKADSVETCVEVTTLAAELIPALEGQDFDKREAEIEKVARKLRDLCKPTRHLEGYFTTKRGWHLPG